MPNLPKYLVGIGASAGGLDAIERFFTAMPDDTGLSFVVVQHLSPDFRSMMDELLARHTSIPIHQVEDKMAIEANGIYLIPPRKNMAIVDGRFRLTEQDQKKGLHLPIDIFFHSLASNFGQNSIAVVLSGTGSDGSRGLESVHEAGGLNIVQDIESSGFDGMPRNAIATGKIDLVCPPGRMAAKILQYIKDPEDFPRGHVEYSSDTHVEIDSEMIGLFRLFRQRYGIDFSMYKPATINRRLERRIQLTRSKNIEAYITRLEEDTEELDALYRDLLVEVTRFFRDQDPFDRLRFEIIPEILQQSSGEVRVWVPGCATGEEAYSIAMLFQHVMDSTKVDADVKIFATDVHHRSLEAASAAVFQPESMQHVPDDFRKAYFTKPNDLYHLTREIREMVVFAPHDLTKDPPFTRLDLISCRNVLIYLEPEVQQRVLAMFHFGLQTGGTMFLGPSETVGNLEREFEVLDSHWRIFRKLRDVRLPEATRMPLASALSGGLIPSRHSYRFKPKAIGAVREVPDVIEKLLSRYVPPSLLVNQFHELVHSFGSAREFLNQPEGAPTLDVLKMVAGDLRTAISAALHRAAEQNVRVLYRSVKVQHKDTEMMVTVSAEPYTRLNEKMFLISLEEQELPPEPTTVSEEFDPDSGTGQRLVDLERELAYTRESLQATVEELETSNEELQSTNEELVASNEELQSTNEELHSVNEELYTVNAEHQRKIDELNQVKADIEGLMHSTEIGIMFLDGDFRVRDFTEATTKLLHLMEQDVGRPMDHIAGSISTTVLMEDLRNAKSSGNPTERRVETRAGEPYLQRVIPYFAEATQIDGFVLTFTSLSALEKATALAASSDRQLGEHQTLVYAISHDMQAPLRQIRDHLGLLLGGVKDEDDDAITTSVDVIGSRIDRLDLMLAGLLEFSRVLTRGAEFREDDLGELFENVRDRHRDLIAEKQARITVEELPRLKVDATQMETVFENLLENALNYCDEPPSIIVGAEKVQDDWLITFTDNGIGIQAKHVDRVFTVFQRLQFKPEVDGDGMGLPIARRIVERHGGTLNVTSNQDGCIFTIKLPVEPD